MRAKAEWAIDSEDMRARGIMVLVKSNYLVKKISRLHIFRKLKLDINPLFRQNITNMAALFATSSTTNQNAALMIDHLLDLR